MQYIQCRAVFIKEIDGDFLAYSGQSGETILLHECAFRILNDLVQPRSYSALRDMLDSSNDDFGIDLDRFLRDTLRELVDRGFILDS